MKDKFTFEEILDGRKWKLYTWGEIVNVYQIREYAILEYVKDDVHYFHPIIWTDEYKQYHNNEFYWDDTNHSYYSLEAAIIGAIVDKYEGPNSQAGTYFCRSIGIEQK